MLLGQSETWENALGSLSWKWSPNHHSAGVSPDTFSNPASHRNMMAISLLLQGAIGSEFKIDASYLSPNVNMAARLEVHSLSLSLSSMIQHNSKGFLLSYFADQTHRSLLDAALSLCSHVTLHSARFRRPSQSSMVASFWWPMPSSNSCPWRFLRTEVSKLWVVTCWINAVTWNYSDSSAVFSHHLTFRQECRIIDHVRLSATKAATKEPTNCWQRHWWQEPFKLYTYDLNDLALEVIFWLFSIRKEVLLRNHHKTIEFNVFRTFQYIS